MNTVLPKTLFSIGLFLLAADLTANDLAVRGEMIYTMAGKPIADGVVLIRNGKITRVGAAARIRIPKGVRVLEAKVVTPGLIDVHSTVGLSGIYGGREGQVRDQDQLETSEPLQPDLRPIDAYNAHEPLIEWVRNYGVTTMHTGHGPGAIISGRTLIVKTRGDNAEEAVVEPDTAVAITLGNAVAQNFESPGTRAKGVAMLRTAFLEAQTYANKRKDKEKAPDRDLKKEALVRVLDGDLKAMVTAHTVTDITAALRLQSEFGFDLWLAGASEAYLLTDELRKAKVPVLLHAPMMRAAGERKNATIESANLLAEAGVRFALQTGYEGYVPKTRVLLFEAAIAAAHGLGLEGALRAITVSPAEILGIDDRVGALKRGMDGDVALFNGDPFEYTTQICAVVIEGEVFSDTCR
jgi:imidazolonepropionase-like amidohydrolase